MEKKNEKSDFILPQQSDLIKYFDRYPSWSVEGISKMEDALVDSHVFDGKGTPLKIYLRDPKSHINELMCKIPARLLLNILSAELYRFFFEENIKREKRYSVLRQKIGNLLTATESLSKEFITMRPFPKSVLKLVDNAIDCAHNKDHWRFTLPESWKSKRYQIVGVLRAHFKEYTMARDSKIYHCIAYLLKFLEIENGKPVKIAERIEKEFRRIEEKFKRSKKPLYLKAVNISENKLKDLETYRSLPLIYENLLNEYFCKYRPPNKRRTKQYSNAFLALGNYKKRDKRP